MRFGYVLGVAGLTVLAGCAAEPPRPVVPQPDRPVPTSEPRAELELVVDLPAANDCEERFDLILYRNRAVELVEWDGRVGECASRSVRIRFLQRRVSRTDLLNEVRGLCTQVAEKPSR